MENQQVFHAFPRLPAELRHAIWNFALNTSCLIEAWYWHPTDTIRMASHQRNPAMIGKVCYEASWLRDKLFQRVPFSGGDGYLYFNFGVNILWLGVAGLNLNRVNSSNSYSAPSASHMAASLGGPFSGLQHAALTWTTQTHVELSFITISRHFPCLKTIVIFATDQMIDEDPQPLSKADLALMDSALDGKIDEANLVNLETKLAPGEYKDMRSLLDGYPVPPRIITIRRPPPTT